MTEDESPYRAMPRFLLCPRCNEVLEEALEGVMSCLRCEGVWIMQPAIDGSFGDPRWPLGASAWWHRSLECPECGLEGTAKVMDASIVGEVIIDRCRGHGVWLDPGELARVLGLPSGVNELVALQRLVAPMSAIDPTVRLAARGRDRDAQRRAAEAAFELDARQAAMREEARLEALRGHEREVERLREHAERMKQLAAAEAEAERVREEQRRALVADRVLATKRTRSLEEAIGELRRNLETAGHDLEIERDRVSALDTKLAGLEAK